MAKTAEERKAARLARKARKAAENGTELSTSSRNVVKLEDLEPLEKVSQPVRMPAEMKILLQSAAEKADKSATVWAREVLAAELGYTVPAEFGKSERAGGARTAGGAEKKAKAAGRRAVIKALLEKYKAGEIEIDESAVEAARTAALAKADEADADEDGDEEDDEE